MHLRASESGSCTKRLWIPSGAHSPHSSEKSTNCMHLQTDHCTRPSSLRLPCDTTQSRANPTPEETATELGSSNARVKDGDVSVACQHDLNSCSSAVSEWSFSKLLSLSISVAKVWSEPRWPSDPPLADSRTHRLDRTSIRGNLKCRTRSSRMILTRSHQPMTMKVPISRTKYGVILPPTSGTC